MTLLFRASKRAGVRIGGSERPTSTLQRWNTLYKEGLVPQDIFTTDYGNVANIFAGVKYGFSARR